MYDISRMKVAVPYLWIASLLLLIPAGLTVLYVLWATDMVALGTVAAQAIEKETGSAVPLAQLPGYDVVRQVGTLGPLIYLALITLPVWFATKKVGAYARFTGRFGLGVMAGFLLIG